MKMVAFKRADSPYLHPDLIVEWGDAAFVEDLSGWETMTTDHFKAELAKNETLTKVHNDWLKKTETSVRQAESQRQAAEIKAAREKDREFARYEAWKRHSGKK